MFSRYKRAFLTFSSLIMTSLVMIKGMRTEEVAGGGESAPNDVAGRTYTIASINSDVVMIDNNDGMPGVRIFG